MHRHMNSACWVFVIAAAVSAVCIADDSVFGGSGRTAWPMQNVDIEMVSEDVKVTAVKRDKIRWDVECLYVFRNTGKEVEVQIGFPDVPVKKAYFDRFSKEPKAEPFRGATEKIRSFKTWVDGKETATIIKTGVQNPLLPALVYSRVFTFKVRFSQGGTHHIKHTYSLGHSGSSSGDDRFTFVLKTGALWKGAIGRANIEISGLNPDFVFRIQPSGYEYGEDNIFWKLRDLEPEEDIHIEWYGRGESIHRKITNFIRDYENGKEWNDFQIDDAIRDVVSIMRRLEGFKDYYGDKPQLQEELGQIARKLDSIKQEKSP